MEVEIFDCIMKMVVTLVGILFTAVVLPWLKTTVIPWLQEKRLYGIVEKAVRAAEKLAETGAIQKETKKAWVSKVLASAGIEIDERVDAFIESAVGNLDDKMGQIFSQVLNEVEKIYEIESRGNNDIDCSDLPFAEEWGDSEEDPVDEEDDDDDAEEDADD